jgi:hypothetical protein
LTYMVQEHPQNVYRYARNRASKFNKKLTNMDSTFELLFISRRLLWEIENGMVEPDVLTVYHMAKLYRAQDLIFNFCALECPLGKPRGAKPIEGKSIESIALNAIYLLNSGYAVIDRLVSTVKDGQLSNELLNQFMEFINWASDIEQVKNELIVAIDRMEGESCQ